jgi:hypothetical protein
MTASDPGPPSPDMGERVFLAVPAAVLYGVILYGLV